MTVGPCWALRDHGTETKNIFDCVTHSLANPIPFFSFGFHHWSSLRLLLGKLCRFGYVAATEFLESVSDMRIEIIQWSFWKFPIACFQTLKD